MKIGKTALTKSLNKELYSKTYEPTVVVSFKRALVDVDKKIYSV